MITKALIIDEPWLSKILSGEKDWEMRSTQSKFRGRFGLIRKGSGLVIGIATLSDVSGPYDNAQLASYFRHHQVGEDLVSTPDYKWRYAWELSCITSLAHPVPYIHKSGAVTWVELDDDAVQAIAKQLHIKAEDVPSPKNRIEMSNERAAELSSRESVFELQLVDSVKGNRKSNARESLEFTNEMVPVAKDGSRFVIGVCNGNGVYTVGEKGSETKFVNYSDALNYLKSMNTAKWRRPNSSGNWGIVSAVNWEVNN